LLRVRVIYSYIDGNRAKNASIFSVLFCPLKYSNQTPAAERIFCRKRGYGTPSARGGKDIRAATDNQSKKVKLPAKTFDVLIYIVGFWYTRDRQKDRQKTLKGVFYERH
jgi:hypothetical protein